MRRRTVSEIIRPYKEGTPIHPSVTLEDRIVDAIEVMVNNNVTCIAVVRNNRPIGVIHLENAFEKVGLRESGLKMPC